MKETYCFKSEHFQYHSIEEKDTDILVLWRSDVELIKYYYNHFPITRELHLDWYTNNYLLDNRRIDFIAFDKKDPVGFVALTQINYEQYSTEINYTIGNRSYKGKHLGVEMINAICEFGRKEFQLKEFIAMIHKDNLASQKTALSSGFELIDNQDIYWKYRKKVK